MSFSNNVNVVLTSLTHAAQEAIAPLTNAMQGNLIAPLTHATQEAIAPLTNAMQGNIIAPLAHVMQENVITPLIRPLKESIIQEVEQKIDEMLYTAVALSTISAITGGIIVCFIGGMAWGVNSFMSQNSNIKVGKTVCENVSTNELKDFTTIALNPQEDVTEVGVVDSVDCIA